MESGRLEPLTRGIAPRTALTLAATITANVPLPRCRVGFEIIRSDGMVMFHGTPMVEGAAPVDLAAGMSIGLRVNFRANVLRGTYRVVLHVGDTNNLWLPIHVPGLASFIVLDTTRISGCAELEPSYELRVSTLTT
jgi:hypothetical protein